MPQPAPGPTKTVFDDLMEHNQGYAKRLILATCKHAHQKVCDSHLHGFAHGPRAVLGLSVGDAHMIRNAGGIATDDAIRSLILSTQLLGTRAIAVIQHTQCGLMSITDEEFRWRLSTETGRDASHLRFTRSATSTRTLPTRSCVSAEIVFLPKQVQSTRLRLRCDDRARAARSGCAVTDFAIARDREPGTAGSRFRNSSAIIRSAPRLAARRQNALDKNHDQQHGNIRVEGDFEIVDPQGTPFGLAGRTVIGLCRCGHSKNKPFCDGSHNSVGSLTL